MTKLVMVMEMVMPMVDVVSLLATVRTKKKNESPWR